MRRSQRVCRVGALRNRRGWTTALWSCRACMFNTSHSMSHNEKHLRLDAVFKTFVDFCVRNSFGVTFVWQPVAFDHHFFLDFIFH